MGRSKKTTSKATQRKVSKCFNIMLKNTSVALGKFVNIPGNYWDKCPEADKEKIYRCIVIEFVTAHDFGAGMRGSGFKVHASLPLSSSSPHTMRSCSRLPLPPPCRCRAHC